MTERLRLRHLWFLVPFWALAVRSARDIRDNSFLWHVQAGTDQLAAGEVLRTDPYSLTATGAPWRTQSWLIELAYGRLEASFPGLGWTPWFLFSIAAIVLVIVLAAVWPRTGPSVGAVVVIVVVGWVAQPYVHPRPALVGFVFFALTGLLTGMRKVPLWAVPGVVWLWAAVHGSFIVGAVFLLLDAVRRRSPKQGAAVALGLVAASFTAHGLAVWEILYRFLTNREGLVFIQEWQPADFTTPWLAGFLVALAVLMVGLGYGKLPPGTLWLVIPAVGFALTSARSVFPALLLLAPWLADASRAIPDRAESPSHPLLVWGTALVLAATALALLAQPVSVIPELLPSVEARAAIAPEPLFNTVGPGGALIYAEEGKRSVFIDDRVELYGVELFERYQRAAEGREWRSLFDEFAVRQAILPASSDLIGRLAEAGWRSCHSDGYFEVMAVTCPNG